MAVASNVCFIWTGTNGTIPTGWTQNSNYSKYLLTASNGNDGGGTAGSATHNHLDLSPHTHTFAGTAVGVNTRNTSIGTKQLVKPTHTHGSTTSNSSTMTIGSTNNDPSHVDVIFLQSGGTHEIADDMVGWFDESGKEPASWQFCDGSNSSPDLRNTYLKNATNGGDSNLTASGSDTHLHTVTHGHASKASANTNPRPYTQLSGGSTFTMSAITHVHNVTLSSGGGNSNTTDYKPTYKSLIPYQNQTGGSETPHEIIGFWLSTNGSIPNNWDRYGDMDDFFLRCPNVVGDALATGGNALHSHTTPGHIHGTTYAHSGLATMDQSFYSPASSNDHLHGWTIGSSSPSVPNCTSQANYPEYVRCIWIRYSKPDGQVIKIHEN